MNVEEIQSIWTQMSSELEKQKKLTNEIIMQMTQERYKSKLQTIAKYEGMGAIVCFASALIILFNFYKLDTWYLVLCGLFTLFFLLVLPVLVLRSIRNMKRINIATGNYSDNLLAFSRARNQFLFTQRIGIGLAFVLILTVLPVAGKIMNNRNLIEESEAWIWYIPIMMIFLVFFSLWGYNKYKRITISAENIIKETAEN
ncbi:MAG: hypothetical protein ACR2MM_06390 [Flavobacteriaceae bacterium]